MNSKNLIISDDWSLDDDKNELKVKHRRQESVYKLSQDVITSLHLTRRASTYFVFDEDTIVLMYDADTGIIYPLTVNEKNILCKDERSMRTSHVSKQFTRYLFGEFLRNCRLE